MTHPRDAEAAEYAIGTLDGDERRAFERAMSRDPGLLAAVRAWEEHLTPLSGGEPPVEPDPRVWAGVQAKVAALGADNVVPFPQALPRDALARSRAVWRAVAVGMGSLAAALALFVASERLSPAESKPTLLAVVNRAGDLPALVVRVDTRGGIVQVRAIAAEAPLGHSLQLWSVVTGHAPRSLGLVRAGATRISLPGTEAGQLDGATLAVSVEPKGGSPTGAPTGPVVYSGKLVPELP